MTRVEKFIAATDHSQLSQLHVAREAVWILSHYQRITPLVLQRAAYRVGLSSRPDSYEAGDILARWLEDDGWIAKSPRPFASRGMGAVPAYNPTDKWVELCGRT